MTHSNSALAARRDAVVPRGVFTLHDAFALRALGGVVLDVEGREYIDFTGGIGASNIGHSHPRVAQAVARQAQELMHTCFHVFQYESYVALAERLCAIAPGHSQKKAAFFNSGAEAVENAVKIARRATGRNAVIAFEDNFHGRTHMTMSLSSKVHPVKKGFGPFAAEVYRMPYAYCYRCPMGLDYPDCGVACADHLRDFFRTHVDPESVACLVAEPVTGLGGVITPPPEYFPKLASICDEYGILVVMDEIQTGIGRTAAMFASEHWDFAPDMMTLAKSLAGGMVLSAVVGRAEVMDAVEPGGLGTTFGGNPVSCAAALAVLDIFEEEDVLAQARRLGETVRARFDTWAEELELIGEVRGTGAMLGLELVEDRESRTPAVKAAQAVAKECRSNGVVVLPQGRYGNVIRTLIPLTIKDDVLERGLEVLGESLKNASQRTSGS
jgi:4-aminobutyrate aminotransferase/(S)-3-amino-2-methylpropionate transaminase